MQKKTLTIEEYKEYCELLKDNHGAYFMELVRDWIKFDPFDGHSFYLFSVPKPLNNMLALQPRLTIPEPVPGTSLIRVNPKKQEEMKIVWALPSREFFGSYRKGKIFADEIVERSIYNYLNNMAYLMRPDKDDVKTIRKFERLYLHYQEKVNKLKKEAKERGEL